MTPTLRETADSLLEKALQASGSRDPREFYRERLRELKERNPEGYREAVRYFESTLVPSVAGGGTDPLAAWTEYGRHLAELTAPGRTVAIDESGRSRRYEPPHAPDELILHLPTSGGRALLVGLPRELSEAQRATYDWLVAGRLKVREAV
ncbi:MAG TPA: hypothetical protein VIG29_08330 [Vicinamibacteria bacterium]